jgi:hypothetical protein
MSLVVDFRLQGEAIDVTEAAAAVPDVTLEIQEWQRDEGLLFWYVWASGDDLDRVTAAFEALSHVEDVLVMNDAGSVRLYRITLVPNIEPPMDLLVEGTLTEGYIEPEWLRLSGRCTGRDVLVGTWNYLRKNGIDVTVDSLRRPSDDPGSGRLTDAQFEALVTAYDLGYFDESTQVTHAEIADELGISRSSLSSRLRRAEQRLVKQELER